MSRSAAVALAAALATRLPACAPEPFVDMRREAGTLTPGGSSSHDRPTVCYNTANATRDEVQALADSVCAETGRVAVYESTDLLRCTALQPHRSKFRCVKPERTLTVGGVRRLQPGVLGVRVPNQGASPPADSDKTADDLPIPQVPPLPEKPQSPDGDGLLGIF